MMTHPPTASSPVSSFHSNDVGAGEDAVLPARRASLDAIYALAAALVDDIGVKTAAEATGVSGDTIRRRMRGELAWSFEELIDLARFELNNHDRRDVAKAITKTIARQPRSMARPLLLPTNLRQLLRLVGRLTTEIADTLDDGKVDCTEAERLIGLLHRLDQLTTGLQVDLQALIDQS